jgi:hypothetical protein
VTLANTTELCPCVTPKFIPLIVTEVPEGPEEGERLEITGANVNETPLLETPPTVTSTRPVVAPDGAGTVMLVLLQLEGVAGTPLNVTLLLPGVDPKPVPDIVTEVPGAPELGLKLVIPGPTVKL